MQPIRVPGEMWAHTPTSCGQIHTLEEHLRAVAECARGFASKFSAGSLAATVGFAHDLGKADPRFQTYLRAAQEGTSAPKCPHSAPSAAAYREQLGPLGLAVLGHHGGIPDKTNAKRMLDNADPQSVEHAKSFACRYQVTPVKPLGWAKSSLSAEMLIRMVFSCLVDADFLDTARHFNADVEARRGDFPLLPDYVRSLGRHLSNFSNSGGAVNAIRQEVLDACNAAANQRKGAYRLTVPTGGGKTLSGLSFALQHAEANRMDRAIIAIPYTSIIDQTAEVYREAVGQANVLEHHSGLDLDQEENEQAEHDMRRRLNIQNWDSPLVVTTTVQLFESLLHNKPSRCRKLHNIVNSVILLDEVQALPPKHLGAILDVLNELVEHYGCTVVFCTATQLDYSTVDDRLLKNATEIVPDYPRHFAALKRVDYQVEHEPWSVEDVAERLLSEPQVLAVLNTRKDSMRVASGVRELARALDQGAEQAGSLFHLSTLMCPHHRKAVLQKVRERLKANQPVRLVSTQVIEAGVDVDFPIVLRDLGPLDRIIQVAGRCNREGRMTELGKCVVFQLEGGHAPQGSYATAIQITRVILAKYGAKIDHPEMLHEYSRELFRFTETGSLNNESDRAEIQKLRKDLAYQTVANTFRMIEQNTTPLIVESYPFNDVVPIIADWEHYPGGWFRRISPFLVNVYSHDLARLSGQGMVRQHDSGAWIYSGPYDRTFGITADLPDPADLIA